MNRVLIIVLIMCSIILTACGPGTAEMHKFKNFDEFIEILDDRFMFPAYYPDGFDPDTVDKNNVGFYGEFSEFGVENQEILYRNFSSMYYNIEGNIPDDFYYIKDIYIEFMNSESTKYEYNMHRILRSITDLRYYNKNKIYVNEFIRHMEPYNKGLNRTVIVINNSYTFYIKELPYRFTFAVVINTLDETTVNELLPEVNEMTYTEAMKMYDSLQPLNDNS